MPSQVPCVAVVENMSYFDGDDGRRYTPFGAGSGDRIQREFGLPHIVRFPIAEDISQAGDGAVTRLQSELRKSTFSGKVLPGEATCMHEMLCGPSAS